MNAIPVLAYASDAISFTIENVTDIAKTRNGEVLRAIIALAHDCVYVRSPPREDNEVESFGAGRHGGPVTRLRACLRFEKPDVGRLLGRAPELRTNGRSTLRIRDIAEKTVPEDTYVRGALVHRHHMQLSFSTPTIAADLHIHSDDPLFEGSLVLWTNAESPIDRRLI